MGTIGSGRVLGVRSMVIASALVTSVLVFVPASRADTPQPTVQCWAVAGDSFRGLVGQVAPLVPVRTGVDAIDRELDHPGVDDDAPACPARASTGLEEAAAGLRYDTTARAWRMMTRARSERGQAQASSTLDLSFTRQAAGTGWAEVALDGFAVTSRRACDTCSSDPIGQLLVMIDVESSAGTFGATCGFDGLSELPSLVVLPDERWCSLFQDCGSSSCEAPERLETGAGPVDIDLSIWQTSSLPPGIVPVSDIHGFAQTVTGGRIASVAVRDRS